jgi:hypothetical protein
MVFHFLCFADKNKNDLRAEVPFGQLPFLFLICQPPLLQLWVEIAGCVDCIERDTGRVTI